jgi:peptide/nickel transport system substrate-binding protein
VVGGAACVARASHCDLSRGVVCNDAANTVTFHLVAPNPEFLDRLALADAFAVPRETPNRDIGLHALPTTGPYKYVSIGKQVATLARNPYFHEWSHAAKPDGYPDRIVYRHVLSQAAELAAIERGSADYEFDGVPPNLLGDVQTRFASQLHINPALETDALVLNTKVPPFNDVRVRRAINYAIDRGELARLVGQGVQPTCQLLPPGLPGYRRYCPYTIDPNPAGLWNAPDLAKAQRLIAASHTRGTAITIWDLGPFQTDYTPTYRYLVSLFDRLGYPARVNNVSADNNAGARFGDSRSREQAGIVSFGAAYPSASTMIQGYACRSFVPDSLGNDNLSEFCDHRLDAQFDTALGAESNNSPDAGALWAQADRTVTDQAPIVPLTTPSSIDFVSARVGNYQYPLQQEQLWVH